MANSSEPVPNVERYDNGTVKLRGAHLDGEMHGAWAFYRRDGSLMRSGSFDRGRQVGVWTTYDRTGAVVRGDGLWQRRLVRRADPAEASDRGRPTTSRRSAPGRGPL